jgi:cell division inhibitor SepF
LSILIKKIKDLWSPPDDKFQYEDEPDEEVTPSPDTYINKTGKRDLIKGDFSSKDNANKVVNIHTTAQLQVVIFKPERFGDETRVIADELLKTHTVVLNLENTIRDSLRRILDFLSGVAYANGGKIKRVATSTFIITPYNVDLTGDDLLDELESNGVYF